MLIKEPKGRAFKACPSKVKILDDEKRTFGGWASTIVLDRWGEVVLPSAFRKTLKGFMKNPVGFLCHNTYGLPSWKTVKAEIRDRGLWVEGYISETAEDVWILVKEEILRSLSIGFMIKKSNYDEETGIRTIKEVELLEISLVGIPMNPETLIEQAKSKGMDVSNLGRFLSPDAGRNTLPLQFDEDQDEDEDGEKQDEHDIDNETVGRPTSKKEDMDMPPNKEEMITLERVEELVQTVLDAHTEKLNTKFVTVEDAKQAMSEVKQATEGVITEADLKVFQEKNQEVVKAAMAEFHKEMEQKWVTPSKIEHDLGSINQAKRLGFLETLRDKNGLPSAAGFKQLLVSSDVSLAAARLGIKDKEYLLKEFQDSSDFLMLTGAYFGMIEKNSQGGIRWVGDPSRLRTYRDYNRLLVEFAKALDTETAGEGAEWLPTYMSGELAKSLDIERGVVKRIDRITLPGKTYKWPLQTSRPVVYKVAEATADAATATILLSTPGSSDIVFTAKGVGAGVISSGEEIEDSIIPILQTLRADFITALLEGEEDALINGDDSSTHQDTDTAAGSAALIAKLFKGLRYDALSLGISTYDTAEATGGTTAFEYGDYIRTMKASGKYALKPKLGFWIVSYAAYFKTLAFTQVTGQAALGLKSVSEQGYLSDLLGHDIVPSDKMREDLDATGVNGASANDYTGILYVYGPAYKIGDRRQYTIESDRTVLSDQLVLVAKERIDFKKMVPLTDKSCSMGIKITTA